MAEKVMVIVPRTAPALFAYLKGKFRQPLSDGAATGVGQTRPTPSW